MTLRFPVFRPLDPFALAAIVRGLVEGLPLASTVSVALELLREQPRSAATLKALLAAQAPGAPVPGQILGAALGEGALPDGWGEGLDCAAELSELASQLA